MSRYNADLALVASERPKGTDKTPRIKASELTFSKIKSDIEPKLTSQALKAMDRPSYVGPGAKA